MLALALQALAAVGARGWIAAAVAAALAFPAGLAAGAWREAARADIRIEAALQEYRLNQQELENVQIERANRARRDAERNAERPGGLLDDDPWRRD